MRNFEVCNELTTPCQCSRAPISFCNGAHLLSWNILRCILRAANPLIPELATSIKEGVLNTSPSAASMTKFSEHNSDLQIGCRIHVLCFLLNTDWLKPAAGSIQPPRFIFWEGKNVHSAGLPARSAAEVKRSRRERQGCSEAPVVDETVPSINWRQHNRTTISSRGCQASACGKSTASTPDGCRYAGCKPAGWSTAVQRLTKPEHPERDRWQPDSKSCAKEVSETSGS